MSQGIDFVKIEDGKVVDSVIVSRSPAIKAFINTSNMGPNAHAGQDFGWRLGPVWYKKLTEARENPTLLLGLGVNDEVDDSVLLMKLWNLEAKAAKNKRKSGSVHSGDDHRNIIDQALKEGTVNTIANDSGELTYPDTDGEITVTSDAEPTPIKVKDESKTSKVAVKKISSKKK